MMSCCVARRDLAGAGRRAGAASVQITSGVGRLGAVVLAAVAGDRVAVVALLAGSTFAVAARRRSRRAVGRAAVAARRCCRRRTARRRPSCRCRSPERPRVQSAEQPSPSAVLPSSHSSPRSSFAVAADAVDARLQVAEQPSPSTVLPSSHSSPVSTVPLPQTGSGSGSSGQPRSTTMGANAASRGILKIEFMCSLEGARHPTTGSSTTRRCRPPEHKSCFVAVSGRRLSGPGTPAPGAPVSLSR